MPTNTYPHSWLYLGDAFGTPSEIINGARLARNLVAASLCGSGRFDNVLADAGCAGYGYQPTVPVALNDAVLWLDAVDGAPSRQFAPNRGTGGPLLNATLGAGTAVGTDEPLWLGGTEKYLYTPSVVGNNATIPSFAGIQITGDIEIALRVSADDWTPAAVQSILSKYVAATAGYEVRLDVAGTISFIARLGASDVTATSTAALPATDGKDYWIKVTRASASGNVNFYYALGGSNVEPLNYAQLGTANVATTAGVMTAGAQAVYHGERNGAQAYAGKFYRSIIRSVIAPSTVANLLDIDFTANASQASFTATVGGTVTINRSATGRKTVAYLGRPVWLFGTDDFMTIPDSALLDFDINEPLSVIAVFRQHNTGAAAAALIGKQTTFTGSVGWGLGHSATALPTFDVHDGAAHVTVQSAAFTASSLTMAAGVRSVTADTAVAYTNSTAGTPLTDTTTVTSNNANAVRIGSSVGGAAFLDGELMAVAVWRRALSATEIANIANFYRGAPQIVGQCWTAVDFTANTGNPWYNASLPESAEAFGFFVEEWTGLDGAHHKRAMSPSGQNRGGAYYGPQSHDARTWKLNVLLHGSTERGLNYLFNWLQQQLLDCCNSVCDTRFAWIRQVCPSDPDNVPQEGVVRAERVVLLEGPTWESPPSPGDLGCFLRRVSFTLGVGDPCLYQENTPLNYAEVTTTGTGTGNILSNCATFAGNQRQVRALLRGNPGFGLNAPVVTIASPAESSGTARKGLPVLRIAGYLDPLNYGDPCRATLIGELILEGYETSGYEIIADMAKRKIRMRPNGTTAWLDGSRLIGKAIRSGMTRWWSFGSCDAGIVVVEPAYTNLETNRVSATSLQVSQWTVRIESAVRQGCC